MLLTTALLWGSSYSYRKMGLEFMTPFFFNFLRFFVAFLFLLVLLIISRNFTKEGKKPINLKTHIKGGFLSGTTLAFGTAIQQWALLSTTAGKVGFITSLYTVFVPILGLIIFKTKVKPQVWVAVSAAFIGLLLISTNKGFSIIPGDLAAFASAIVFGFQIIIVGHYTSKTDGIVLSTIQMFFGCLWNLLFTITMESGNTMTGAMQGAFPIIYTGVFSIGLAFTLQIFAQKRTTPSVAAIIMSLESVFAVLFATVLLHETMSTIQLAGCLCIFAAVIIAQVERKK
ncbi:MAG: DMT family transporter, partial [Peptostreptococcaceae bacterium]|nr:DMT family transporter [Peptostreptococcaceae bacterium]